MGDRKIYFDREKLRDRIYACWIGKNIGGTMGYPYEGTHELLDIHGFETDGILPNDDLDLQLVWLRAMDEMGPESVNEQVLGEYWLSYIGPAWNEYGIGKSGKVCCRPYPVKYLMTSGNTPTVPGSARRSGPASSPAVPKKPFATPSTMPAWITGTTKALTPPSS